MGLITAFARVMIEKKKADSIEKKTGMDYLMQSVAEKKSRGIPAEKGFLSLAEYVGSAKDLLRAWEAFELPSKYPKADELIRRQASKEIEEGKPSEMKLRNTVKILQSMLNSEET